MITLESIKAEDIFDLEGIKDATKSAEKASKDAIIAYNKLQQILKDHNNAG